MSINKVIRFAAIMVSAAVSIHCVYAQSAPVITTQPRSQMIIVGSNMALGVAASGTAPLFYQWKKEGVALANQTKATLNFTNIQSGSEGVYSVVISNNYGSVTSRLATIGSALTFQWQQSFGGNGDDLVSVVEQTSDGNYIVGGHSGSVKSGNKTNPSFGSFDFWVVKLDDNGNKLWEQSFGGNAFDYFSSLRQTSDGGFILGGGSNSDVSGNKTSICFGGYDYWVIKIDADGNKQWEQTFGGTGNDYFSEMQQTPDGGFFLAGESDSAISGNKTSAGFGGYDFWVVRLDSNGNKLWEQSFGGNKDDRLNSLQKMSDGGYALGGHSLSEISGNKTNSGIEGYEYWVVKIDPNGNKQWERSFPVSNVDDYRVIRLEAGGNLLWDKSFGGSGVDLLQNLRPVGSAGYILGGSSDSEISGMKTSTNYGNGDYWAVRLDAAGNKLWDKSLGGNGHDVLRSIQESEDGGYILAGHSSSEASGNKTSSGFGGYDYWIVKLRVISPPKIISQPQSQTNDAGSTVTLAVTANNALAYQWRMNGHNLFGETTSSLTLNNFQAGHVGRYEVVLIGAVEVISSSAYLFLNGEDSSLPKVAITSPNANGRITNNFAIAMSGTAKDTGLGVAQVLFRLNEGSFQPAQGTKIWSAPLTLVSGTNKVEVKSIDFAGNESLVTKRTFFGVTFSSLILTHTGSGSIISTPSSVGTPTNLAVLEVGRAYKLKAVPASNYVFSNWVGSAISADPIINFVMQSNMTLTANFIPNPFANIAGKYHGLFRETDAVTHQSAGFFVMTLRTNSSYSGKLYLDGDTLSLSGKFNVDGTIFRTLSRAKLGKSDLTLALVVDVANGTDKLTGNFSTDNWTSFLASDRAVFNNNNPATAFQNNYTILIPGFTNSINGPPGYGYGSIQLSLNGFAKLTGATGDGMKLTQSIPVSKNGEWPLYAHLYKSITVYTNHVTSQLATNKSDYLGSVFGWITFTNDGVGGGVTSIKTGWTNTIYPGGFTNQSELIGFPYIAPVESRGVNIVDGRVTLSSGNLVSTLTRNVFIKENNGIVITPTNNLVKLTLAKKTGLLSGSFQHPDNGNIVSQIKGVVLQDQSVGAGYFLGTNQSGLMLLQGVE